MSSCARTVAVVLVANALLTVSCGSGDSGGSTASDAGNNDASTGGASGAGTGGGAGSGGATVSCPSGGGPKMVALAAGFCIDSTEVTRDHYATWLATNPSLAEQPSQCVWNSTFVPQFDWPPTGDGDRPVGHVDWCDAHAYCKGVGKRLCGAVGGGPTPYAEYKDATKSQWTLACTSAGKQSFPYGNQYDPQACAGVDYVKVDLNYTVAAGSLTTCQSTVSGYAGVFDLSGNVAEWEDSCEPFTNVPSGQVDYCRVRGGGRWQHGYTDPANNEYGELACVPGPGIELGAGRSSTDATTGFRCCGS